ncbi:hypothetical protein [Streptomyces sp. NPDC012825]|uniref:hypothetical protein n=1 Tax=Streptomyces sp. NPDC012825 TaxID=3364851 RepID=UPI003683C282
MRTAPTASPPAVSASYASAKQRLTASGAAAHSSSKLSMIRNLSHRRIRNPS